MPFGAHGYCAYFILSVMDRYFKPGMDVDSAMKVPPDHASAACRVPQDASSYHISDRRTHPDHGSISQAGATDQALPRLLVRTAKCLCQCARHNLSLCVAPHYSGGAALCGGGAGTFHV